MVILGFIAAALCLSYAFERVRDAQYTFRRRGYAVALRHVLWAAGLAVGAVLIVLEVL